jgi:di/tricarboxylate transporter
MSVWTSLPHLPTFSVSHVGDRIVERHPRTRASRSASMTTSEWTLIGVFLATIALMFGTRLRPDVVAILAALSLGLLGVIPDGAVFQGLSSTVVMTLIGLFILAEGLEDTGVIRWAAQRLAMLGGGGSERRLLLTLMATAAVLSLGMSNVAVGALFIPASSRVARASGVPLSGLLLPVSYASLLGGMATIFTSANIIMSDLLIQQGSMPLGMMDFALTGGLVAVAGVTYMLVAGHRFLPERDRDVEDPNGDFFGLYKLGERFWEFEVTRLAARGQDDRGCRLRRALRRVGARDPPTPPDLSRSRTRHRHPAG